MNIADYFDERQGRPIPQGARANIVRPELMCFFQEQLPNLGRLRNVSLATQDYVVQRATEVALTMPEHHGQERFSQVEVGKQWILGYADWYSRVAGPVLPGQPNVCDDVALQPHVRLTWYDGVLKMAQKKYPGIDWTEGYIRQAESLWMAPSITESNLQNVERFMCRCQVLQWSAIYGLFGTVSMPAKVRFSGMEITLGWEITHDWILPKDANHGFGLLHLTFLLKEIDKLKSVGYSTLNSIRPNTLGYKVRQVSQNKTFIIAIGKGTGTIVTCYQVN